MTPAIAHRGWLGGALVVASAAALRYYRAELKQLRPLVREPAGLQERLQASMRQREISKVEREAYARDGVVVLRGLLDDPELLREIALALGQHQQFHEAVFVTPWEYNGVARALLRRGVLTSVGAQLLGATNESDVLAAWEAPIWGTDGTEEVFTAAGWHQDQVAKSAFTIPMVTLWIATTEAPHPLEFLRGSHRVRREFTRECNTSRENGPPGERVYEHHCSLRFGTRLSKDIGGQSSFFAPDLRPGDVLAFDGNLAHRGVGWPTRRTALSVRFVVYKDHHGIDCSPRGVFHGHRFPDPFHCVRERALPRGRNLWPDLNDRLPQKGMLPSMAYQVLGEVVAHVSSAAYLALTVLL